MIELRFYKQRYNMDPAYYSGKDDVYQTHYYPDIQVLRDDWRGLMSYLAGETYSAWIDGTDIMLCGGAFDPNDIDDIEESYKLYMEG